MLSLPFCSGSEAAAKLLGALAQNIAGLAAKIAHHGGSTNCVFPCDASTTKKRRQVLCSLELSSSWQARCWQLHAGGRMPAHAIDRLVRICARTLARCRPDTRR